MTSTMTPVDPTNAAQLQAWDGPEGDYWAAHAARFEKSMAGYDSALFAAAAIRPGDHVLDVGCGTGATTREAARRANAGTATGVDLSGAMIAVARSAAVRTGVGNACFLQGDAQVYPFPTAGFDVVISRTGAMFFGDPAAAFANLARATRPGGRLVLLVWQAFERNPWIVRISTALAAGREPPAPPDGAPGPFAFADPNRLRGLLTRAGYTGIEVADVREPLNFGRDPDTAHTLLAGLLHWMVADVDPPTRAHALAALRATMAAHHSPRGVELDSAAWLVTATRREGTRPTNGTFVGT
jgi:SAM-dependent methyltransferase